MLEMIDWSLVLTLVVGILLAEIATVIMWIFIAFLAAIVNACMS